MTKEILCYIEDKNIIEFELVDSENFIVNQSKNTFVINASENLINKLNSKKIKYVHISNDTIYIEKQPLIKRKFFNYNDLVEILKILRSPNGCSWDKAQTHESLRKNLLEETYELLEVLDINNIEGIKEELGDYILQAIFHIVIGEENNEFTEQDIYTNLCTKLITRHTHIFGEDKAKTPDEALNFWNIAKNKEKCTQKSVQKINKLCKNLPSIMYAEKAIKIFENLLEPNNIDKTKSKIKEILNSENLDFGNLIFNIVLLSKYLRKSSEVEFNNYLNTFIKENLLKEKLENKFGIKIGIDDIRAKYFDEIYSHSIEELITILENENWKPRN